MDLSAKLPSIRQLETLARHLRATQAQQLAALAKLRECASQVHAHLVESRERGACDAVMQVVAALARFWWIDGQGPAVAEFVTWMWEVPHDHVDAKIIAAAHQGTGELAYARADYASARQHLEAARAQSSALGRTRGQADASNWLGMVAREQGHYEQAIVHHQRADDLYRACGDRWGCAHACSNLGVVAFRCQKLDRAVQLHSEALELRRELDDLHGISSSLGNLALCYRTRGELEQARALYEQSLDARKILADRWGIAGSAVCLCVVETQLGHLKNAHTHFLAAVQGFTDVGDDLGLAESAEAAMALFAAECAPGNVGQAYAVAIAMRRLIATPMHVPQPLLTRIRGMLGASACHRIEQWAAAATLAQARAELVRLARNGREDVD